MEANSNSKPEEILRIGEGNYQVRWNIQRNDKLDANNKSIESWDYEYNSRKAVSEISRKDILVSIIREKYDVNDEVSLAMMRPEDSSKLLDHEAYVNFAKATSDQILINHETVQ